jgi:tRNA dimethylallyltransferase
LSSPLLVIVGPTCTGKTALAVAAAQVLAAAEILNADSRQVRRGLRVGTCAPTPEELHGVPCNLLDLCDPGDPFTVADWLMAARLCLERLDRSGCRAVVAGGTGLYVTALVDGFDLTGGPPDAARRAERTESAARPGGLEALVAELQMRDPEGAAAIDRRNPRRVIRALEILDAGGGSMRAAQRRVAPRVAVMIGLDVDRPTHTGWIEHRSAAMFEGGGGISIQDEVRRLLHSGFDRRVIAGCGIGYAEALDLIEERMDLETAVAATVRRTLRYARAQRTWFRRDTRISWLRPDLMSLDELLRETLRLAASHPD